MRFCLFSKSLHYKPKIDPGGDEQGVHFFCGTFGVGGFSPIIMTHLDRSAAILMF